MRTQCGHSSVTPGGAAYGLPVATRTARLRAQLTTAAPVGGGLTLVGASAYAVLGLAGHALTPRDYAALGSLYLLITILGPGIFVAVEQQANREVSGRLALGRDIAPVLRATVSVCAVLAAVIAVGVLACAPVLVSRVFADSWALVAATVVAVLGTGAAYLMRGIFAGQRRYHWYGASLAAEGLARLLPCVALVLLGWASLARFGLFFGLGCGVAAVVSWFGLRGHRLRPAGVRAAPDNPSPPIGRLAASIGFLACASGLSLLVANLAPVVLTSRVGATPDAARLAASFVSLFVLVRIPIFLFGPVQAFLLPGLTSAAERGDAPGVRERVRTALCAVAVVGLPGVLAAWLVGPWASTVLFNAPVALPGLVAGLLGVSTVAMMAAQVLQPALVALGRNRAVTTAWVLSSAVFLGLLFAPIHPLPAAVAAQLVAPLLVTGLMGAALLRSLAGLAARNQDVRATVTNSL